MIGGRECVYVGKAIGVCFLFFCFLFSVFFLLSRLLELDAIRRSHELD